MHRYDLWGLLGLLDAWVIDLRVGAQQISCDQQHTTMNTQEILKQSHNTQFKVLHGFIFMLQVNQTNTILMYHLYNTCFLDPQEKL